ncbi:hypothetical protein [Halomonas icarae]|uniref:Uncharacterized protein n=1 Tax=Halomonas icarae TaxID=2691040 RepID=A0A7X4VZ20_9GAMM|nr:hypothetical protein [Halomonas icarae]MDR5901618.1 hypothetical protein [Halomonas icarae]NAW12967.1 hypothetical protein [Halomonas icarae]
MHGFTELVDRCAAFTLEALREANESTVEKLQTSSSTSLVKALTMIQLQKAILAVGMFSIFEANLQDGLGCSNGFDRAKKILGDEGEIDTKERFDDLYLAINVLKHGRGRSYDALVAKAKALPFRIKLPDESFFFEGDVSEVSTLVEVDDAFVQHCGDVISDVSEVIRRVHCELI